jgi:hypothetical protein
MLELFNQWCKLTKRSGGVLLGSSIREFFVWLEENGYKINKK